MAKRPAKERWFLTSFCNFPHRLSDGKPINHECLILDPQGLEAERAGDFVTACSLLRGVHKVVHRGLRRDDLMDGVA